MGGRGQHLPETPRVASWSRAWLEEALPSGLSVKRRVEGG